MTVNIVTKTVQVEANATAQANELTGTVDTFIESKIMYDDGIKALEPIKKTMEKAKGTLIDYADAHALDDQELPLDSNGERSVVISAKYKAAQMKTNKEIFEAVGLDTFLAVAKVSVTELKRYLSPDEFDQVCQYANTAARRIKIK